MGLGFVVFFLFLVVVCAIVGFMLYLTPNGLDHKEHLHGQFRPEPQPPVRPDFKINRASLAKLPATKEPVVEPSSDETLALGMGFLIGQALSNESDVTIETQESATECDDDSGDDK